jgi:hypothetical protein
LTYTILARYFGKSEASPSPRSFLSDPDLIGKEGCIVLTKEANVRGTKMFLAVCFAAALFSLISTPDADAFCRLRNRHSCCTDSSGVPWYAFCYRPAPAPKDSSKDYPTGTTPTCSPPPNDPTANYCVCCKSGAWSQCTSSGTCDGMCFCINQSDDPVQVLGECPKSILPFVTRSQSGCFCAYVFDSSIQKLRYAYPYEYNNPRTYHVVYGPMGAISGGCVACSR